MFVSGDDIARVRGAASTAGKGKASLVRTFAPSVRASARPSVLLLPEPEKGEIDVFIISIVERATRLRIQ